MTFILRQTCYECGESEDVEVDDGDVVSLDLFDADWTEDEDGEAVCGFCSGTFGSPTAVEARRAGVWPAETPADLAPRAWSPYHSGAQFPIYCRCGRTYPDRTIAAPFDCNVCGQPVIGAVNTLVHMPRPK